MSVNEDHAMGEQDLLEEFDNIEEDLNNLEVERVSNNESESEGEDLDLTNLATQFDYQTKRRQKLRLQAKSALVDKYGSTEEFRQFLASKFSDCDKPSAKMK